MTAPFMPGRYTIELRSGRYLDLSNPDPAQICLGDVVHGLSHLCRYSGQCERFWSVAQHCLVVVDRLREQGHGPTVQLAGLHHDDAEAFCGDVSRPLKALLSPGPWIHGYSLIEHRVSDAVRRALELTDLPWDDPAVKEADDWALAVEARHLMPSRGAGWVTDGIDVDGATIPWLQDFATVQRRWLRMHRWLVAASVA